jgi:hypothetical protein
VTAPGCPDRFESEFTRWVWSYPTRSRPKVLAAVADHAATVELVRLRTPRQVRKFLADVGRTGRVVDDR